MGGGGAMKVMLLPGARLAARVIPVLPGESGLIALIGLLYDAFLAVYYSNFIRTDFAARINFLFSFPDGVTGSLTGL
jgi:hypothetical protein